MATDDTLMMGNNVVERTTVHVDGYNGTRTTWDDGRETLWCSEGCTIFTEADIVRHGELHTNKSAA